MGILTPSFVMDLETRMRLLTGNAYQALSSNLYWSDIAKQVTITGAKERLIWLLETAQIQYVNKLGGEVQFDDLLTMTTEFEVSAATGGFSVNRNKLEDIDGGGIRQAAEWASQIGAYAAYWPQKQVAAAVLAGSASTSLTYDGLSFFNTAHLVNPRDSSKGTFANDLTGAASGVYPGACPIDSSVTLDVAFNNLQKALAYIRTVKMPNGVDPRFLRAKKIFVPPALSMRAQQLTNSKIVAQAAASGGGSADVEAVIRNWGIGQPQECDEFGAAMTGGSDTTYYILAEQIGANEMGPLMYLNREPFSVIYNDQLSDAQLARMNELQWLTRGRNVVAYGHPFLLFKVRST